MKHKTKSRIAFTLSGILLIILLILGGLYLSMSDAAAPSPAGEKKEAAADDDGFPEVDWKHWKSINSDIVGWITVPGTEIDYPIVQAPADDPTYYLHHDIYKKYNIYGCPYLDAECAEAGLDSKNAVIFGHHMNNGSMFSDFANYSNLSYAKKHQKILLQTPDSKRILDARFSRIINGTKKLKQTSFADDADFQAWYASELDHANAVVDSETVPTNVTTFVTCSYNFFKNERTLVYASVEALYLVQ